MMNTKRLLLFVTIFLWIASCNEPEKEAPLLPNTSQPNILWLVAEDLSPIIPPFGDSTIATPNLSKLASEGVRYVNFFSIAGVCAPSRAALATGMYPISIGALHMRTRLHEEHKEAYGLPSYETVPPSEVKMMSELLRENGYYCTNNDKRDYQFKAPVFAWDESSGKAHWRNRPSRQTLLFHF